MSTKHKPGAGDVEIILGGEKKTLTPSIYAIRTISRSCDGLGGAISKVEKLDFDTIALVIAAGLQLTATGAEGLEDKIFETGMNNLQTPVTKYLVNLYYGGREPDKNTSQEAGENPPMSA
jgi:hypothetical protein